ncbi:rho GTPase-activating protein 32-like isoform X1 [Gallus gallus]|uniref:rho GTPase-activating protein 32-like isoform X1 n=1 Tax=Gallus gallus TaxID=9031 RepID=UPI001AEAF712|nr:rho GTPase-activating protein 32-like isoform X1 [Gallus gallus]
MPAKNLAIVWAPNLFRSQQNESACASGRAACMELQRQSDVVEFIINHADVLFCSTPTSGIGDGAGRSSPSGPKSVRVSSPATMLLSVEEAQAQRRGHSSPPALTRSTNIEVEEGPRSCRGQISTQSSTFRLKGKEDFLSQHLPIRRGWVGFCGFFSTSASAQTCRSYVTLMVRVVFVLRLRSLWTLRFN